MTYSDESIPRSGSFFSRIKSKALEAIAAFSFTEKMIFYFLCVLLAGSSFFLLSKLNEYFTVEAPVAGGTVREGVVGFPRYINPLLSVTDAGKDLSILIYSGLLKATPNGDLINDLAESYTISPDGLIYTVTLKNDIYFHDGAPVTTKDVDFTIKKSIDPNLKSLKAANWKGVTVGIIDDKHMTFTLRHPYGPFLENLTVGILPEHIWKDVESEAFLFSQFNFEPIGSGPYKISKIQQDDSGLPLYYHLTPFKNYALGKPFIDDLYIYFYSNEEKLLHAFADDEIDQINSVSPQKAAGLASKKSSILRSPLPRVFGLFFNQNEAPVFANKEVRQALDMSIDRNAIIKTVLDGFGTPAYSPLPTFVSNFKSDNESAVGNLEAAAALLEKAGWQKNSNGIYEKKGKSGISTLSFSISTSNVEELKGTAYLLKETWEKLGANVEVKVFDLADLNQNIIRQRKYDSLLFGEAIGRDLDLYAFWHSSERNDPGLNVSMYTNSKVDALLDDARKSEDRAERLAIYESFEKEITSDVPAVFIYSPDFVYISKKNIKGIEIDGITSASERFLGVNNWFINTQKIWTLFDKNKTK